MDNAMNNTNRAEQIEERLRDLQERLNAWQATVKEHLGVREADRLNQVVEAELTQVRAPLDYREHVSEFQKALQSATGDGVLIQRLYEEIFLRSTV